MDEQTTREQITERLRRQHATPSELGAHFDISREATYSHLRHVAQSVDGTDEQFLVRPPLCRDCGFEDFEDLLNHPSRCPECKSEAIREPAFQIAPEAE